MSTISRTQESPIAIAPTYSVHIKRVGDDEVEPDPFPDMNLGDTIRYYTKAAGEVSIQFVGPSPFRRDDTTGTKVPGEVIFTVVSESVGRGLPDDRFECRCFITVPDEKDKTKTKTRTIGYLKAGGRPRVPRP